MINGKIDRSSPVPLYAQIKDIIISDLRKGLLGQEDTFPSLKMLSKKYSVSLITSRRVVSDLGREGYLETAKGLKTRITNMHYDNLSIPGLSKNIGIFFFSPEGKSFIDNQKMPWTSEIFSGIQESLKKAGYISTLISLEKNEDIKKNREIIIKKNGRNFDGFICFSSAIDKYLFPLLEESNKPYVMINRRNDGIKHNYISANYYQGSSDVANYLVDAGIKSYLIIIRQLDVDSSILKLRGFQETLMGRGIELANIDIRESGGRDIDCGIKTLKSYSKEKKGKIPGAIFADGDYLAIGAINFCHDIGLSVPKDVSVVGSTGLSETKLFKPSLSVLQAPMFEMGESAVKMLFGLINTKSLHTAGVELPMRFVPRESVKRIPAKKVLA